MVQVNWTQLAISDLQKIYYYISEDSKKYDALQVLKIREKVKIFRQNPSSGKHISEFNSDDFRELIEGNYRIIYKIVSEERVDIITIHHSSRDLTSRKI
tara:strand:- start:3521 stop:3817 length:297 start_codon:yes stop_codon:yes gene_type:complete